MANETTYKSDNELLQEISLKLSELIALNGIRGRDKNEQIKYLVSFGFSNAEIARLLAYLKARLMEYEPLKGKNR